MLLSINAKTGRIDVAETLPYGLCGAELVELLKAGRIKVETSGGPIRIVVLDPSPIGDDRLDKQLALIRDQHAPPHPTTWIRMSPLRGKTQDAYLKRLKELGAITVDAPPQHQPGPGRIRTADSAHRKAVKARLDEVVRSGEVRHPDDAALAGLVYAIGLSAKLYRGPLNRRARKRFEEIAKKDWGAITILRSLPKRFVRDSVIAISSPNDVRMAMDLDITYHSPGP